jgi:DNA-directed RNA polymerase subunit RPC12/RpoP
MGRYPREARDAQVKCIDCNAPVVTTVDGRYVCVDCGGSPLASRRGKIQEQASMASVQGRVATDGSPSASNGD